MREYNINSIVTSFSNLRILEDLKISLKYYFKVLKMNIFIIII